MLRKTHRTDMPVAVTKDKLVKKAVERGKTLEAFTAGLKYWPHSLELYDLAQFSENVLNLIFPV